MPNGVPLTPQSSRRQVSRHTRELEDGPSQRRVPVRLSSQHWRRTLSNHIPLSRVMHLLQTKMICLQHLISEIPLMYVFSLCISADSLG